MRLTLISKPAGFVAGQQFGIEPAGSMPSCLSYAGGSSPLGAGWLQQGRGRRPLKQEQCQQAQNSSSRQASCVGTEVLNALMRDAQVVPQTALQGRCGSCFVCEGTRNSLCECIVPAPAVDSNVRRSVATGRPAYDP